MRLFFDSSAFAKRYVLEEGSEAVALLCAQATEVYLASITMTEVISVFARLKREGKQTDAQYETVKQAFLNDLAHIEVVGLSDLVFSHSILALEKNTLRTLDALHIACAKVVEVDQFITADKRQFEAAKNMGLNAVLV